MYEVKNEQFEGPLDLLLHLVDKNQLDITEISLASICGEYEEYLNRQLALSLEVESSFLVVFASLLEIKSIVLLPVPPKADEEEEKPDEHELVQQLREYRKFKELALKIDVMRELHENSFRRINDDPEMDEEQTALLTSQISVEDLMDMYVSVMRKFSIRSEEEKSIELKREEISMQFILKLIDKMMKKRPSAFLHELFDAPPDRLRFIVTFLALLELAKRKKVSLIQNYDEKTIVIINRKLIKEQEILPEEEKMAG